MKRFLVLLVLLVLAACAQAPAPGNRLPSNGSLHTLGGADDVRVTDLAEHGSGVYAVGYNTTDPDDPFAESNIFVRKYSTSGSLAWRRQFRFADFDTVDGVAADANNNAYVAGSSFDDLGNEAYVRKYTAGGRLAWTRKFAATQDDPQAPGGFAVVNALAAHGGDTIYAVGYVYGELAGAVGDGNLFIRKYTADGRVRWTRRFGFSDDPFGSDSIGDAAVDGHGNAYVVGVTDAIGGIENGTDAFVRKYTPSGGVAWTRRLDFSPDDNANAVAVSDGNVYLGVTYLAGFYDFGDAQYGARVAKVFTDGGLARGWGFNYNTPNSDYVEDLSADGNIYLSARTEVPSQDGYGVVVKLKPSGDRVWGKRVDGGALVGGALVVRAPNELYLGAPPLLRRLDGTKGATVWSR